MPNPQGILAGRAYVEIIGDNSKLVAALNAASRRLKDWGQQVTRAGQKLFTLGAATTAGFAASLKVFAATGDAIHKMSLRTGTCAEALSELSFAAERSGTDIHAVETGIRMMQRTLANAVTGSTEAAEALSAVGLSAQDLTSLTPDQQLEAIADGLAAIADPAQRTAAAMRIFGRSGTALLPLVAEGAAGIRALRQEARALGLTMTTEEAGAAATVTDAMTNLFRTIKMGVAIIGSALAPAVTHYARAAATAAAAAGAWLREHRPLVTTAATLAIAIAGGGLGLIAAGKAITLFGAALGAVATGLSLAGSLIGTIAAGIAAIATPAGAATAALLGIGAAAIYATGAWKPALEWTSAAFGWLRTVAIDTWQGISDAIAAGDLALAAKVAISALQLIWAEAVAYIQQKWATLKAALITLWHETVHGLATLILTGVAAIQTTWTSLTSTLRRLWVRTTTFIADVWNELYRRLAMAFVTLTSAFSDATDAAAKRNAIDDDLKAQAAARKRAAEQQLAAIDQEAEQHKHAIDQNLMDALATLEEDKQRALESAIGDTDAVAAARKAADQARQEWDDALKAARDKAAAQPPLPEIADIPVPTTPDVEMATRRTISSAGTFSALAARGLAITGPWDKIAHATENTAENTRRMLRLLEQAEPPTFT